MKIRYNTQNKEKEGTEDAEGGQGCQVLGLRVCTTTVWPSYLFLTKPTWSSVQENTLFLSLNLCSPGTNTFSSEAQIPASGTAEEDQREDSILTLAHYNQMAQI